MPQRFNNTVAYGVEATPGTTVPATTILTVADIPALPQDRQVIEIEEALGVRAKSSRSEVYEFLVEDALSIPNLAFQHLPFVFSPGVKGNITPTETTPAQSDYAWDFTPPMTATSPNCDTITLEMGDDELEIKMPWALWDSIKIAGEIDQAGGASPITADITYFAQQVVKASKTTGLSIPALNLMNAKLSRFYRDTTFAGAGTTEYANFLRGFEWECLTPNHFKMLGSANKYYEKTGEGVYEVMLTLKVEGDANAEVFFDDMRTDPPTNRMYSVRNTGPVIGTGVAHHMHLDVWGVVETVSPFDEEDKGNNIWAILIRGKYDGTGAQMFDVDVVTNQNTI